MNGYIVTFDLGNGWKVISPRITANDAGSAEKVAREQLLQTIVSAQQLTARVEETV